MNFKFRYKAMTWELTSNWGEPVMNSIYTCFDIEKTFHTNSIFVMFTLLLLAEVTRLAHLEKDCLSTHLFYPIYFICPSCVPVFPLHLTAYI